MLYTIAESIKSEIAEKVAIQAAGGYMKEVQGAWCAVDTDDDGVLDAVHHDSACHYVGWATFDVDQCVNGAGYDFSPDVDRAYFMDSNPEIVAAYEAATGEEAEAWELRVWAAGQPQFQQIVREWDEAAMSGAVELALDCVLGQVEE